VSVGWLPHRSSDERITEALKRVRSLEQAVRRLSQLDRLTRVQFGVAPQMVSTPRDRSVFEKTF
jgi:hypothetical protein